MSQQWKTVEYQQVNLTDFWLVILDILLCVLLGSYFLTALFRDLCVCVVTTRHVVQTCEGKPGNSLVACLEGSCALFLLKIRPEYDMGTVHKDWNASTKRISSQRSYVSLRP